MFSANCEARIRDYAAHDKLVLGVGVSLGARLRPPLCRFHGTVTVSNLVMRRYVLVLGGDDPPLRRLSSFSKVPALHR
jgi:hypothetical protein